MRHNGIRVFCFGVLLFMSGVVSAGLRLTVNDDLITGEDGLIAVVYKPGERRLELASFFGDLRCMAIEPPPTGDFNVALDQVGPAEEDATYMLSSADSIEYTPATRTVRLVSAAIEDSDQLDCTHKLASVGVIDPETGEPTKGATALNGFEDPLKLVLTEASDGVGFDLRLENVSGLFVAKTIAVPLALDLATGQFPPPQPQFESGLVVDQELGSTVQFGSVDPVSGEWIIPALWPSELVILKVRYDGLSVGDQINFQLNGPGIESLRRSGDPSNKLVTVVNTTTTIGVQ